MLLAADGRRPKLLLQAVPEPKAAKNRMHLDIETPDVEARHAPRVARRPTARGRVRREHGTAG